MSFLGRAKKMMKGKGPSEPPRPQYYAVACPEGHLIRGQRTDGYQALRCPECGEGVFVLPRSPLPLPPAPASPRTKRRPAATVVEDAPIELAEAPAQIEDHAEIEWIEPEPTEAAPARRPPPAPEVEGAEPVAEPSRRPRPKDRPAARSSDAVKERPPAARPSSRPVGGPSLVEVPTRRNRSRHAWIIFGVVGLVVMTVGYRFWRQRLQNLPHEAQVNRMEGLAALEKADFDDAKSKLTRAARAFEALGATDETAVQTHQKANEAAIYADLDHDTPRDILDEISRLGEPDGIARFDTIHKGRSLILESDLQASEHGGAPELIYRIFTGRGPTPGKVGRIDLSNLKILKAQGDTARKSVFLGARYQSIRLEGGIWWITLEPDSGVPLSSEKALQAVGFVTTGEAGG